MPNLVSKIVAFILSAILLFIFPTYQNYKNQDQFAYQVVYQAITHFVDNVRSKGYITPQMYEDFQNDLSIGSYLFKTEIVHKQKIYHPIYSNPNDPSTFTGEYDIFFDEYYWEQIKPFLFDENSSIPKEERKYRLSVGDFFYVHVENITKTKATMLFDFLTGNIARNNDIVISIPYGGMVLNEDY